MWIGLHKKLKIEVRPNQRVIRTSIRDCRQFERRSGFILPASYVSYISEIGGGSARQYFQVYCPNQTPKIVSIEARIKELQGSELLSEIYDASDLVARMIPFGDTVAGDIFAWDPAKRHGQKHVEYEIFVLPRDSRRAIVLTRSFSDFVKNFVFGRKFEEKVCGGIDPEWKLSFEYKPFTIRKNSPKAPRRSI